MNRMTLLGGLLVILLVSPVILERSVLLSQVAPVAQVEASQPVQHHTTTDDNEIAMIYTDYTLTQGHHGLASEGGMAIDVKAGRGSPIYSPIDGVVTQKFVDGIGNPVLVIENSVWRVMLLHGVYSVNQGDQVKIGQAIGTESNLGNTRSATSQCNGNATPSCGNHSHVSIKKYGQPVSALQVFGIR